MISAPKPQKKVKTKKRRSHKNKDGSLKYNTLVKNADFWFNRFIRERDGRCQQCGKVSRLTAGHVFSKVCHALRWERANVFGQCAGHNMSHEFDPRPYHRWYIETFGQEAFDALHMTFLREVRKYTREELTEIAETYKKLCNVREL